ncbi:O-antigen ligase family protein [Paracoccaceae bacterium]|nr:O-antigen ligase family protein [Paracoccaceae bacterium]
MGLSVLCIFVVVQSVYYGGHLFLGYSSHNAAGAVIGMLIIYQLLQASSPLKWASIPVLVLGFALLATGSRQGILALSLVVFLILIGRMPKSLFKYYVFFTIISLALGTIFLQAWLELGRPFPDHDTGWNSDAVDILPYRNETVAVRLLYYFPRAVDMFFQNPIFGVGLGTSNDRISDFSCGILFCDLKFAFISYSADNPHNQFITVLAEQGLIGWLILGLLLSRLYKLGSERERALLLFGLVISLFENRLASPSFFLTYFILTSNASKSKKGSY